MFSLLMPTFSLLPHPPVFPLWLRLTFQGMAASKPTSWLSKQLYLLNHLAYIWDLNWRSGLFPSWPRILSLVASLQDITLQAFGV